jgi:transcriptional regulator GlxA family with amidase domain
MLRSKNEVTREHPPARRTIGSTHTLGEDVSPTEAAARLADELDALSTQLRAGDDPDDVLVQLVDVTVAQFPDHAESLARRAAAVTISTATDEDFPPTLRRALAYIEANAHRRPTLAEIAAAAYISPRALQLVFKRHLHTTPMAHLRRVRLERAHIDLVVATAASRPVTVTEVASRWGFHGAGRFAASHRSAFRELPSEALRRRATGTAS